MEKKLLIILSLIGITFISISQENSKQHIKTTGGLKLEVNLSNFYVSGLSGAKSEMRPGATFGGFMRWDVSKLFALQGELLYHYKSSNFIWDNVKREFQYIGMEIPIYAIFKWNLCDGQHLYVGIGPYAEFGFSAKIKKEGKKIDLYEKDEATELSTMTDFNSGFGIILGYEFDCNVQVNVGYKISITNILDANSTSITLLPGAISLGIGYRFGK